MASKPRRNLEQTMQEIVRRALNDREIRGTERLKWVLAGIKLTHLQKTMGTEEHGSGFNAMDDDEPDELTTELTTEEGATDGPDGDGRNGSGGPA